MIKSWTKGLDATEASDLKDSYNGCAMTRVRLGVMLKDKITSSHTHSRSKILYDNPNWALLQADQRGYERALHEIMDLIK